MTAGSLSRSLAAPRSLLRTFLLRIRPAFVAAALKRMLKVERVVVDTKHGRFLVDPVSNLGASLASSGEYEPEMRRTLEKFLGPGRVFVDIGANEGYFSVIGRKLVGDAGKIVAVEPQSRLLPILQENFRLNAVTGVQLVHGAVSDTPGKASLHLSPDTNTGSSSLDQSTSYTLPTEQTEVMTLSELFSRQGVAGADLVKMDIEGFEYEAVLGSRELFTAGRIRAFALELHPPRIERRGLKVADITNFLTEAGYALEPGLGNTVWVRRGS
jgi:FkbM family methyltransferase